MRAFDGSIKNTFDSPKQWRLESRAELAAAGTFRISPSRSSIEWRASEGDVDKRSMLFSTRPMQSAPSLLAKAFPLDGGGQLK
jgi:hypothetical protein